MKAQTRVQIQKSPILPVSSETRAAWREFHAAKKKMQEAMSKDMAIPSFIKKQYLDSLNNESETDLLNSFLEK